MATEIHDGVKKPLVDTDSSFPDAQRREVIAVGIRDDGGRSPLRLDNSNQLKTAGSGGGGGGAATIAEGADVNSGSTTDAAVTGDNPGTLSAKIRGINKILASVWDNINNVLKISDGGGSITVDDGGSSLTVDGTVSVNDGGGSVTVDGTVSVGNFPATQTVNDGGGTLSVDDGGSSITVDGTVSVGNFPASQTVNDGGGSLTVDAVSWPLPTGASTEATLSTRLSEADFDTKVGSLTESAPGSDTASSGLNGRLQRIAQRLSTLISLVPAALTGSGNFKVSIQETAVTVPVSAVSLPLPTGAATEATLALVKAKTDNLDVLLSTRTKPADQQHVLIDAGGNIIGQVLLTDGTTVASVFDLASSNPLAVAVVDAAGAQITSFGGGTGSSGGAIQVRGGLNTQLVYDRDLRKAVESLSLKLDLLTKRLFEE